MRVSRLKDLTCVSLLLASLSPMYAPQEAAAAVPDSLAVKANTVMVSPYHASDKDLTTAAVSSVGGWQLEYLPGINRTNLLNGRVTGFLGIQHDGELGIESNSMYIRGLRSISSDSRQAAILVDGYVRKDANRISPADIESVTILKDAAATALYGLRGANGVVLITTKHGRIQPLTVSIDAGVGFQAPTRLPKYLGSYDYARLYNEAAVNDGGSPKYDQYALDSYLSGDDPYNYPDVDWMDRFMKKSSVVQRYNVSVRGGTGRVRYYASVGYVDNSGLYNVDKNANTYKTNANYENYSLRGNVDINVTKKFVISLDIASLMAKWNYPGAYSNSTSRILNALTQTPPNAHPIFNEDGSLSGTSQYLNNPYGLLNNSGYSIFQTRSNYATLKLDHDLDFITQGLSVFGSFSFDSYFEQVINRNVGFVVYEGSLSNQQGTKNPATQKNDNSFSNNYRTLDLQAGLDYARSFGNHNLSGRIFINYNNESGNGKIMPHVYKGLFAYAHYDFKRRYIADFTIACQGSEQIGGNGYDVFPSVSAGWIISEENFLKDKTFISFLKLRASYGVSGNDTNISYFQKSSFFSSLGSTYLQGQSLASMQGFRESQVGVDNIMAERSHKTNVGVDIRMFKDRWSLSVDGFYENNDNLIIAQASIPNIIGVRGSVKNNIGRMTNSGFEIATDYTSRIGRLGYSVYGNFSFARNRVKEMQETDATYRFNKKTGYPINSSFGLKSDGLFFDYDQIAAHATQTYGTYNPGDIRYLDLSKDGYINEDDRTYLGYGDVPEYVYGFGIDLNYRGFDLNVAFQGVGNVQRKLGGYVYWEFRPDGKGNVMEHHLDRWAYDPANGIDTRLTAKYPRLSLTGNDGNNRGPNSDYWLRDASYLRLKSVELGYTLPARAAKAIWLKNLRIYVSATNLFTSDKIDILDPETTTTGTVYPLQRTVCMGLNISF